MITNISCVLHVLLKIPRKFIPFLITLATDQQRRSIRHLTCAARQCNGRDSQQYVTIEENLRYIGSYISSDYHKHA